LVVSRSSPPRRHSIEGVINIELGLMYAWCRDNELRNATAVCDVSTVNAPLRWRTETLLTPHPIHSSFALPFRSVSRSTPCRGRTRSVAIYTCVSVSIESTYLILPSTRWSESLKLTRRDVALSEAS
jgi:hypothetical protein